MLKYTSVSDNISLQNTPGGHMIRRKQKEGRFNPAPYILISPALVLVATILIYPLCTVFYLSFQNYNPTKPWQQGFAGLDNFINILTGSEFWRALWVSVRFVAAEVILQLVFGMILALILNQTFRGRGVIRAVAFIPWALSGVLTAVLWNLIFSEHIGLLNSVLRGLGLIESNVAWLANQNLVLGSVIIAELWRGIPFFTISLLAAMQSISGDIYEAAQIDGATRIQTFRSITLPLLKNAIVLTTLLRTVWEFNSVDMILSLTGGGPISLTTTLSILISNQAMKTSNYGYGSALSVLSFALLSVFAVIYMRASGYGKEE